ncbi:hypothetical protein RD792_012489 [Penstemon davidsonii]|uniref:Uncharacterized protein n=1 Tax=Penstemon davidsonii TaxID=160366 RepID=A0ABR0CX14_9LAMI|nr:hypothetical protein RD792_012489 [Penstemon davidsonii]
MGRSPCCYKVGLKKGPWTPEEDQKLLTYIQQHGHGSWRALPPKAGLERCGKSCRLRWTNYLRPDIKRGKFSLQEEQTIIQLHALLGNRWSAIATHLPKRTDNEIKNYWNTHLKKRLTKMGIDPVTHRPKSHDVLDSSQPKDVANLSHIAQWESVRVEAESRLQVLGSRSSFVSSNTTNTNYYFRPPPVLALPPRPPCLDILKVWRGSLESPNSIFNFSDNMINVPTFGLVHQNSFVPNINSVEGILDNSVEVFNNTITEVPPADSTNYDSININYPGFMEGFVVNSDHQNLVGGCGGVLEDNKTNYYWNNVSTNFVTSPMGSPVF